MQRSLRTLLFVSAASMAVGCGDTTDPFITADAAADTGEFDTSAQDVQFDIDTSVEVDTSVDTVGTDAVETDTTGDDVTETDAADTGGTDTTPTDAGDDSDGFVCGDGVFFTGQVFNDDDPEPLSPDGGAPRFEPWEATYDAGIGALLAAAPENGGDNVAGEWTISEATVIATEYNNETTQRAQRSFWLADGTGAIAVFFPVAATENHPTFSIKVGQRISGTITELGNYNSMRQITGASEWTLQSEDNPVYIKDLTEGGLTTEDINSVVRITGTLTSLDDADCGGSKCYTMAYNGDQTTVFRSSSAFLEVGQCVTFVGPVRGFNDTPQIDTLNFGWLWSYSN